MVLEQLSLRVGDRDHGVGQPGQHDLVGHQRPGLLGRRSPARARALAQDVAPGEHGLGVVDHAGVADQGRVERLELDKPLACCATGTRTGRRSSRAGSRGRAPAGRPSPG